MGDSMGLLPLWELLVKSWDVGDFCGKSINSSHTVSYYSGVQGRFIVAPERNLQILENLQISVLKYADLLVVRFWIVLDGFWELGAHI